MDIFFVYIIAFAISCPLAFGLIKLIEFVIDKSLKEKPKSVEETPPSVDAERGLHLAVLDKMFEHRSPLVTISLDKINPTMIAEEHCRFLKLQKWAQELDDRNVRKHYLNWIGFYHDEVKRVEEQYLRKGEAEESQLRYERQRKCDEASKVFAHGKFKIPNPGEQA